jgi:branched-chain amino acid transport system ATP-binding protein
VGSLAPGALSAQAGDELIMLTLSSLSKNFGGLQVLQDVSLTIPERGIFGLIGPNGAGKTTVFNLVTGLLAPSAGHIEFYGERLNGMPPHRVTRRGIARTFQNTRIFKEMTLIENVSVPLGSRPRYGALSVLLPTRRYREAERLETELARTLLAKVGLADRAERLAGTLSYGEQRRLEIARALATEPKLLLLDEPAAGMNSSEKQQLMEEIVKLDESGLSVLIIEHDMSFIMGLCREITVLNFGSVIARGAPDEIRASPAVIEAYLGRGESPELSDG